MAVSRQVADHAEGAQPALAPQCASSSAVPQRASSSAVPQRAVSPASPQASPPAAPRRSASAWPGPIAALLLVLGTVLFAFRDTLLAMVSIWSRSDTFAHAFLVPPIALWLMFRQRDALARERPQPCAWVLLPMAGVALAWLLGDLAAVNAVTQLASVALLVLAVPAVLGLRVTRLILFPLGFLFFAVPIGEFLMPQLMAWTADFTVLALRASGIPVFREGMQFVIPSGHWSVVEACSGVRYLIASFMVGTLFAYLNYRSMTRRWVFVGISIAVPVVANWVRAYLIVLLGHASNNTLAVGADHLIYGWLFFGLVIGVMFAIGALWAEPAAPARDDAAEAAARVRPAAGASAPANPHVWLAPPRGVWATALAAVALLAAPHLALRSIGPVDDTAVPQLAAPAAAVDGWRVVPTPANDWKPAFHNPSTELSTAFASARGEVGVYIGYYRAQNYSRKLVSSDNELVKTTDPVWAHAAPIGSVTLRMPSQELVVRTASLRALPGAAAPERRIAVWQLYWAGGQLTSSDAWAKAYGAFGRLMGLGDDAAVIVLHTPEDRPGAAAPLLESFALANLEAIVLQLRRASTAAAGPLAANPPLHNGVAR